MIPADCGEGSLRAPLFSVSVFQYPEAPFGGQRKDPLLLEVIMYLRYFQEDMKKYGIVACGPLQRDGAVDYGVVLRALTAGNAPAETATAPHKYVVHTMYVNEAGRVSFEHGQYFDITREASVQEAFEAALAAFVRRMHFKMGIAPPWMKAVDGLNPGGLEGEEGNHWVQVDAAPYEDLRLEVKRWQSGS